jgi:hypothetical protein
MSKLRIETLKRWTAEASKARRVWQKSEINAVIKALQSKNFVREAPIELHDAYLDLLQASEYGSFEHSITKEQSAMGISYLRSRYFKKNGEPRKSSPFNEIEQNIIRSFKKFTFVGYYEHQAQSGWYVGYTPVYRVYSKSGSYFDYSPIHWGTPLIVSPRTMLIEELPRFTLVRGGK